MFLQKLSDVYVLMIMKFGLVSLMVLFQNLLLIRPHLTLRLLICPYLDPTVTPFWNYFLEVKSSIAHHEMAFFENMHFN